MGYVQPLLLVVVLNVDYDQSNDKFYLTDQASRQSTFSNSHNYYSDTIKIMNTMQHAIVIPSKTRMVF